MNMLSHAQEYLFLLNHSPPYDTNSPELFPKGPILSPDVVSLGDSFNVRAGGGVQLIPQQEATPKQQH